MSLGHVLYMQCSSEVNESEASLSFGHPRQRKIGYVTNLHQDVAGIERAVDPSGVMEAIEKSGTFLTIKRKVIFSVQRRNRR